MWTQPLSGTDSLERTARQVLSPFNKLKIASKKHYLFFLKKGAKTNGNGKNYCHSTYIIFTYWATIV